jgi:hypothetical protein
MTQQDTEWTTLVNAFDRPEQLETARNLLIAQGIDGERIDAVARPDSPPGLRPLKAAAKRARGEIAKDGTAAVTGAMMATYVGLPILGPFVPAATIAGGLIGWLIGAGLPRSEAEEYGERLLAGEHILVVRVSPHEVPAAERALKQAEARPTTVDLATLTVVGGRSNVGAPAITPTPTGPSAAAPAVVPGSLQPATQLPGADSPPKPEERGERAIRTPIAGDMMGRTRVTYGHTGRGRQSSYGFRGPNLDNRGEETFSSDP